jgi:diguanylate cyclase (GGDEF)-like protein
VSRRDAERNGPISRRPRRLASSILVAVLASSVALLLSWLGTLDTLDRSYLDLQTRLFQRDVHSDVVIVEIDPRTLKELGQWPLPRSDHGQLIRNLQAGGVATIFLDIDFSSPSLSSEDAQLAKSLEDVSKHAQVILPAFWQPTESGATSLILSVPLPQFRGPTDLALVNLAPGPDGLVREVPAFSELGDDAPPLWRVARGERTAAAQSLPIDYRISPASFTRVSYVDVLQGRKHASVSGKKVFVGATALELGDIVAVPVHRALPGVVVQAIAYETARRSGLMSASPMLVTILTAIWGTFAAWLLVYGRWRRSPLLAIGLMAVALALDILAHGWMEVAVPVSPFIVAALVAWLGSLFSSLTFESWRSWWALRRTHEQDALLRQVVEHSSDAILTLDAQHVVRTANSAAHNVLRCDPASLIGRPLAQSAPALFAAIHSIHDSVRTEVWIHGGSAQAVAVEISKGELEYDRQRITTLTLRDVTSDRAREAELRHLALHDALTGLPNRVSLAKALDHMIATRQATQVVALMMLDLDGFKEVNDTLGHSTGDELMRALGQRLAPLASADRHIARLGGDEFAVLWRVAQPEKIDQLAQELLLIIGEPIVIKGVPVSVGTSIGIACCPQHAEDSESLLKRADVALYSAKRKHTHVEHYEPSDDTNSPRRLEMLSALRNAVARDELLLEYQPKVAMATGHAVEVEALCRWQSPIFGRVAPGEFIALAEASDVIKPLTEWTIHQALKDCRYWRDIGVELRVAVNLSARHLQDAKLPQWLEETFARTQTQPRWLELEITESAIMTDPDRASKIIHALHELGVLISIDDFGTGYSSLAYLRTLAVDRIKIDRSFIAGMKDGLKDQVIVESTINLAHGLELEVIAEGIETQDQFLLLKEFGCDIGQGYWIARPMPLDLLTEWCLSRSPDSREMPASEVVRPVPRSAAS